MSEDPWASIKRPDVETTLTVRRADASHPWDCYWGKDIAGRKCFLLEFDAASRGSRRLPNLKGLDVTEQELRGSQRRRLLTTLKEDADDDIFYRLCLDLLEGSRTCAEERAAVATTINRLWRWQGLLKQGRSDKLTEAEQKGLIGELLVIRDLLLPHVQTHAAIASWEGPVRGEGQKDFSLGTSGIEVKARSASAARRVRISSEEQLSHAGYSNVFLVVIELSPGASTPGESLSLTDLVSQLRSVEGILDPSVNALFEDRLAATGYRDIHDYEEDIFVFLGMICYRVSGEFPRIVTEDLKPGVAEVAYNIDLAGCGPYEVDQAELIAALGGKT